MLREKQLKSLGLLCLEKRPWGDLALGSSFPGKWRGALDFSLVTSKGPAGTAWRFCGGFGWILGKDSSP